MGGGLSSLSERLFPDRQASMLLLASHLSSTASSHHAVLHSVFSFVFNRQGIFQFFSFLIFNHVLSLKQHWIHCFIYFTLPRFFFLTHSHTNTHTHAKTASLCCWRMMSTWSPHTLAGYLSWDRPFVTIRDLQEFWISFTALYLKVRLFTIAWKLMNIFIKYIDFQLLIQHLPSDQMSVT